MKRIKRIKRIKSKMALDEDIQSINSFKELVDDLLREVNNQCTITAKAIHDSADSTSKVREERVREERVRVKHELIMSLKEIEQENQTPNKIKTYIGEAIFNLESLSQSHEDRLEFGTTCRSLFNFKHDKLNKILLKIRFIIKNEKGELVLNSNSSKGQNTRTILSFSEEEKINLSNIINKLKEELRPIDRDGNVICMLDTIMVLTNLDTAGGVHYISALSQLVDGFHSLLENSNRKNTCCIFSLFCGKKTPSQAGLRFIDDFIEFYKPKIQSGIINISAAAAVAPAPVAPAPVAPAPVAPVAVAPVAPAPVAPVAVAPVAPAPVAAASAALVAYFIKAATNAVASSDAADSPAATS